jgi:hypothetical protein
MAIILKPRSNSQGVVEVTADLAQLNGRPGYQVLVKDTGLFEWVATGVVDNENIYPALSGRWSKVLESGDITLPFTAEDSANKSLNIVTDAASDVKYPSVKATKTYADSLVTGLLDDRGNFTPSVTSPGAWPTTGGSGTAGAIMKGDIWFCSASGFMGTTAVVAGASFRALVDSPGQTNTNWNVLSAGAISVTTPSLSQVTAVGSSTSSSITISSSGGNTIFMDNTVNGPQATLSTEGTTGKLILRNQLANNANLLANNLSANRNYEFPDASGTLALASQIVEPYKVYTASFNLSVSGVANLVVYRNTIGNGSGDGINDIAWTRDGVNGVASMTGSTAFPINKTWVQASNYISGGVSYNFYGNRQSNNVVTYTSIVNADNSAGAGFAGTIYVEIRVYP